MTKKKENPIHQRDRIKNVPVERAEVLSLLASPASRHKIAETFGCSYDTAAARVAMLQAMGLVMPCGHERTPGGRTWRMLFRTVEGVV